MLIDGDGVCHSATHSKQHTGHTVLYFYSHSMCDGSTCTWQCGIHYPCISSTCTWHTTAIPIHCTVSAVFMSVWHRWISHLRAVSHLYTHIPIDRVWFLGHCVPKVLFPVSVGRMLGIWGSRGRKCLHFTISPADGQIITLGHLPSLHLSQERERVCMLAPQSWRLPIHVC